MILIWALLFGGITAQIVQLDDLRFSSGSTLTNVLSSNWTTTAASSNIFTRTRAPDEMAAIVPEERYAVNWTTRFDSGFSRIIYTVPLSLRDWSRFSHFEVWVCNSVNIISTLNIFLSTSATSTATSYWASPAIDWQGWKRLAIRLDMFQATSNLASLNSISFVHFKVSPSAESSFTNSGTFLLMRMNLIKTVLHTFVGTYDFVLPSGVFNVSFPISFNNTSPSSSSALTAPFSCSYQNLSLIQDSLGLSKFALFSGSYVIASNSTDYFSQVGVMAGVTAFTTGHINIIISKNASSSQSASLNLHYMLIRFREIGAGVFWDILVKLTRLRNIDYKPISRGLFFNDSLGNFSSLSTMILLNANASLSQVKSLNWPVLKGRWSGYWSCGFGLSDPVFDVNNPSGINCGGSVGILTPDRNQEIFGAWRTKKQVFIVDNLIKLALGASVNSSYIVSKSFANVGISLLVQLAAIYPSFHYSNTKNTYAGVTGGKMTEQTLDESDIIMDALWAMDLLLPFMTSAEVSFISNNLLLPCSRTIRSNKAGTSNWQSFHNCAIFLIGRLLGDSFLMDLAVNDASNGFKFQVQNSILDDGFWYEGSVSYHYYALGPLYMLAYAARNAGEDLLNYDGVAKRVIDTVSSTSLSKNILSMYLNPWYIVMPDNSFPAINDMHLGDTFISHVFEYERALGAFPTQSMLSSVILSFPPRTSSPLYRIFSREMDSIIANASYIKSLTKSTKVPALGLGIIRNSIGDYLTSKAGLYGGWHGHLDKLCLMFYSNGRSVVLDPGVSDYSYAVSTDYLKKTLSHSTLMMAGENQLAADGKIFYSGRDMSHFLSGLIFLGSGGREIRGQRTIQLVTRLKNSFMVDVAFLYSDRSGALINANNILHSFSSPQSPVVFSNGVQPISFQAASYVESFKALTFLPSISGSAAPTWLWTSKNRIFRDTVQNSSKYYLYDWNTVYEVKCSFEPGSSCILEWNTNSFTITNETAATDGTFSAHWYNHVKYPILKWIPEIHDWSDFTSLSFDLYSVAANNAVISVILYSMPINAAGACYYIFSFNLDWSGAWRSFTLNRSSFKIGRTPQGWSKIDYVQFSASWIKAPLASSDVFLDNISVNGAASVISSRSSFRVMTSSFGRNMSMIGFEAPISTGTTFSKAIVTGLHLDPGYSSSMEVDGWVMTESTCSNTSKVSVSKPFLPFVSLMSAYSEVNITGFCISVFLCNEFNTALKKGYLPGLPIVQDPARYWLIRIADDSTSLFYWYTDLYPFQFGGSASVFDNGTVINVQGLFGRVCVPITGLSSKAKELLAVTFKASVTLTACFSSASSTRAFSVSLFNTQIYTSGQNVTIVSNISFDPYEDDGPGSVTFSILAAASKNEDIVEGVFAATGANGMCQAGTVLEMGPICTFPISNPEITVVSFNLSTVTPTSSTATIFGSRAESPASRSKESSLVTTSNSKESSLVTNSLSMLSITPGATTMFESKTETQVSASTTIFLSSSISMSISEGFNNSDLISPGWVIMGVSVGLAVICLMVFAIYRKRNDMKRQTEIFAMQLREREEATMSTSSSNLFK